jgi:hypothetical protein
MFWARRSRVAEIVEVGRLIWSSRAGRLVLLLLVLLLLLLLLLVLTMVDVIEHIATGELVVLRECEPRRQRLRVENKVLKRGVQRTQAVIWKLQSHKRGRQSAVVRKLQSHKRGRQEQVMRDRPEEGRAVSSRRVPSLHQCRRAPSNPGGTNARKRTCTHAPRAKATVPD